MILIRTTILLLIVISSFSCTRRERVKPPEDIINEAKMTDILYDVQIAEAIYQRGGKPSAEEGLKMGRELYNKLFEKHGVTKESFQKSFAWYSNHPRLMNDMYEEIIERLNTEQAKLNEKLNPETEKDSAKSGDSQNK